MPSSLDQSGHELTDSDAAAAPAASSKSGSGTRRGRRRADRPRREDEARSSPRSPPPSDVQHSPRDSLARLLVRAVSSEPITPELLDAAGRLAERIALTVSLEEAQALSARLQVLETKLEQTQAAVNIVVAKTGIKQEFLEDPAWLQNLQR